MKISIALCTYNGEKFIREQVNSFLSQTVLPDEIVVYDDGSKDNTISILNEFASANPDIDWVIVQNKTTLGASGNFEKAIDTCKNDLILLSDQDDIWESGKIEKIRTFFTQHPECDAVFSNAALIDEAGAVLGDTLLDHTFFTSGERKNFSKERLFLQSILLGNIMTGATMALRRTTLPSILPFRLQLHRKLWHDGWIGFSLMTRGAVGYIDEPLIKYRIHAAQQVGVRGYKDPFERIVMENEKHSPDFTAKEHFERYLSAFLFMRELRKLYPFHYPVEQVIEKEYRKRKLEYFNAQSLPERKFRLLKWYLKGNNDISFRDLVSL